MFLTSSMKPTAKSSKKADKNQLFGATVMGERGQVVIPKDIRDRLRMRTGMRLMVMQHGDSPLMLVPIEQMQEMIQQMTERVARVLKASASKKR